MLTKLFHLKCVHRWCTKSEKKSPPESTHDKLSFWAKIQDGHHYTYTNIINGYHFVTKQHRNANKVSFSTNFTCPVQGQHQILLKIWNK